MHTLSGETTISIFVRMNEEGCFAGDQPGGRIYTGRSIGSSIGWYIRSMSFTVSKYNISIIKKVLRKLKPTNVPIKICFYIMSN